MNVHQFQEQRSAKIAEMRALGNDINGEKATRFDALEAEVREIDTKIRRARTLAEMERQAEAAPDQHMQRELRSYSVAKAVSEAIAGHLTGLEQEIHSELSRGRAEVRGVMVPTEFFMGTAETRSQTIGEGSQGGFLVPSTIRDIADRFRPALKTEALGAMVLRNLVGGQVLPNIEESGTAYIVGEDGEPTRTAVDFEGVSMAPKTVAAEYKMSRRFLINAQSGEAILRRDIGLLLATKMDLAAVAGSTPIPGILGAGIEKVTTATDFSDTTSNLIFALDNADVPATSRGFLTSPKVADVVRKIKEMDSDRVIPATELFHNQRWEVSSQVPDTLNTNKSGLIYGEWPELVVGYWSGVDLLPNVYHSDVASSGGMLLHAFCDFDVVVRRAAAFAYAEI